MKLVIFSDIHGNQYALDAFLKEIQPLDYDRIIFCGDIFGYYYGQKTVIDRLRELKNLIWIQGNHDSYAVDLYYGRRSAQELVEKYGSSYERLFQLDEKYFAAIQSLPSMYCLEADGKQVGIFHGTPGHPLEGRLYPRDPIKNETAYLGYDYVILGHTHFKMKRRCQNTVVLNPGSLGQQRDGKGFGYVILDTAVDTVQFKNVAYSIEPLFREIDLYDPKRTKLKEILERTYRYEENTGNCN